MWSTHQFWCGLFGALGIDRRNLVFSGDTSEEQGRQFGKGRGTVDCCYPVKCIAGHYGELVFGQREKLDIVFSPMIYHGRGGKSPEYVRDYVQWFSDRYFMSTAPGKYPRLWPIVQAHDELAGDRERRQLQDRRVR